MKTFISYIICTLLLSSCYAESILPDSIYWGQTPPGDSAVIFAPGIISLANRRESKIVFSPNGQECLIATGKNDTFKILYSNHLSGYWQDPQPATFITNSRPIEPFFSPDSLHVFFTSYADIYVSARVNQVWTTPVSLGSPVNTGYEEYHPTVTANGTLYFCSMRESGILYIYRSKYENGNYSTIEKLSSVINRHNSQQDGAYDPFVAADESYIIFTSIRTGGYGQEDQYISYNRNGNWTNPKNIGPKINTNAVEYGSYISPDGKYYFFSRPAGWGPNQPADIYWVKAGFIDSLRTTNFIPYLKTQIPDQTDTAGTPYSYTFPDSTFADDDGLNTLTYSAALSNGSPLPAWLNFDLGTRTFFSTSAVTGTLGIKISATDTAGASASCSFTLEIFQQISVEPINENVPREFKLFQNFPNPFNPSSNITFDIPKASYSKLAVYDINGREIQTLVDEMLRAGSYRVSLNGEYLSSGIYFYKLTTDNFTQTRKMILLK